MGAYLEEKGYSIDEANKAATVVQKPLTGIRQLRGSWIWPFLKTAQVVYNGGRVFLALCKQNGFLSALKNMHKRKVASKKYIMSLFLTDEIKAEQKAHVFSRDIIFSVLVPLFNTPENYLKDMIESIINQTYGKWELCLADASDDEHAYVGEVCKQYATKDSRIVYKKLDKNYGISENTNICIQMATGNYIALFDHDDILCPSALYENMKVICEKDADFIYSDEATFNGKNVYDIITYHFKPDFAIDNLRANNYICHFSVFDRALIDKVGMFSTEYDGSQDHDMILRLTAAANRVEHIAKILYLWRSHKNSVSMDINSKKYAIDAGRRAVRDNIKKAGYNVTVESAPAFPTIFKINYEIIGKPKISIIIPNKDNLNRLVTCIDSIIKRSTYENYEIIIMENNSETKEIFEYYDLISKLDFIKVIYYKGVFNYSRINNEAVKDATGEYMLFLNNDIEILEPKWMEELLMYAQREDVGAVGAKLFYANNTIQHNGIITGAGTDGIAIYSHERESRYEVGYMGRLYYTQNVNAVTAACMMVSKVIFEEVGGFDEDLTVAYNDVDICLKIRKAGYLNVINPYAYAYHYKSISREKDTSKKNKDRLQREAVYMKKKWEKELSEPDPFYNVNVSKFNSWKFEVNN